MDGLVRAVLLCGAICGLQAGAADAAEVIVADGCTTRGCENAPPGPVVFEAAPGEANRVTMEVADGRITLRDSGAPLTEDTTECEQPEPGVVVCTGVFFGDVRIDLGDGNDEAAAEGGTTIDGGPGDDALTGAGGDQVLLGGGGTDRLAGGADDDLLADFDAEAGAFDADVLDGGPGRDTLSYRANTTAVRVDLGAPTGPDGDTLSGFESLQGGSGDDELVGSEDSNSIKGGPGADVIQGAGGDDDLTGDEGADTMSGGPGDDALQGSGGDDALAGDDGNDLLADGVGRNRLDGGAGDDTFDLKGAGERPRCGAGADAVVAYPFEGVTAPPLRRDCERHREVASAVSVDGRLRVTERAVRFGLSLPEANTRSRVTFELRTGTAMNGRRLGSGGPYTQPGEQRARIRLAAGALRRARKAARLTLVMSVLQYDRTEPEVISLGVTLRG